MNPYLRPLYDALYDMLDADRVARYLERGTIEIAPIAFMRGRTLNDAFVILDEAQNTTSEQMKMFLTRLGFGSKAVITGDVTQIDLPAGKMSGLVEAIKVVGGIDGIAFIHFDERDVVRHKLVQQIVKAYEAFTSRQPAPLEAQAAAEPCAWPSPTERADEQASPCAGPAAMARARRARRSARRGERGVGRRYADAQPQSAPPRPRPRDRRAGIPALPALRTLLLRKYP